MCRRPPWNWMQWQCQLSGAKKCRASWRDLMKLARLHRDLRHAQRKQDQSGPSVRLQSFVHDSMPTQRWEDLKQKFMLALSNTNRCKKQQVRVSNLLAKLNPPAEARIMRRRVCVGVTLEIIRTAHAVSLCFLLSHTGTLLSVSSTLTLDEAGSMWFCYPFLMRCLSPESTPNLLQITPAFQWLHELNHVCRRYTHA